MKCGRCDEKESRIDGYCTIYCRDMADLEAEIKMLKAALKPFADFCTTPGCRVSARDYERAHEAMEGK